MIASPRIALGISVAIGVAAAVAVSAPRFGAAKTCEKTWIFFDLGNTLIASGPGVESRYFPGAREYVRELRRRGYSVGLITNVPEKWGTTKAAKIRELKRLVAESWTKQSQEEPMDWSDFPDSSIIIPARDAERKPGPRPFIDALAEVEAVEGVGGCRVVYQGEDPVEVEAAVRQGMVGYVVGKDPNAPFMPMTQLEAR